ncbi:MAG: SPASM domain-containing protein, partial [Candidatus Omnitrophica bacterium]|nr:SPASM domain-containing protein [Candidatus Omnitrophota bacterium]
ISDIGSLSKFKESLGLNNLECSYSITPKEDGEYLSEDFSIPDDALAELFKIYNTEGVLSRIFPDRSDNCLCSAWMSRCYISAYGDVRPCVVFPKKGWTIGNLREESLKDVWSKNIDIDGVSLRSFKIKNYPVCNQCDTLKHCTLCPGLAILENGCLGPVKMRCQLARSRKTFMESLTVKEVL